MTIPPRKQWIVQYSLHRKAALSGEERAALEAHRATWGTNWGLSPYVLEIPDGASGVVASGQIQLSWVPGDPDAQRFMYALRELRGAVAGAKVKLVSTHGPKVGWVGKYKAYTFNSFSTWPGMGVP